MNLRREIERNLLHIFHEEGAESFPITRAAFNFCRESERTLLVVRVNCGEAKVPIPEFQNLFHAEPWFEVVFDLNEGESSLHAGAVLFLSAGYDYERDENITNFCYTSHRAIEELKLEVLQVTDSSARFRIEGLTGAAHGDADTLFAVDCEVMRDNGLKRSIR